MRKVYIKGYINFNNDGYTFIYEDKKLTLISVKNKQSFFNEYKYVEFFEGFTLDGFDIVFYINSNIYYKDGCFICSPRCILVSQKQENKLSEMKFDALRITGDILNRFYSNRNMIEFDHDKYLTMGKNYFSFKSVEETISEEKINLNNAETNFELSIIQPGWKDDGSIIFNNYDTLLRIKYNIGKSYADILKDLGDIESFFKFCTNRNNISFNNIFLEYKNEEKKYEKVVEIIVPYMIENEINKDMIEYELIKGHLDDIFKFLDNSNYVFSIIPDDNKSFQTLSNKDYCAAFSCFESIYQYIHSDVTKEKITKEEIELEAVKEEILPLLKECDKKYKEKNKIRRDFIKRFINIISTANLKLEKCISNEIKENDYIIDSIYYKRRDEIKKEGINNSISKATNVRDDITHNKTIKLDNISIGIYEIVSKLNYIMILKHVGISKDEIKKSMEYLAIRNII